MTTTDPTGPAYYQFPGGIQLGQISGELTGFGAQIVQCAARSCRVDGTNKETTIEGRIRDLEKAAAFAEMEVERLANTHRRIAVLNDDLEDAKTVLTQVKDQRYESTERPARVRAEFELTPTENDKIFDAAQLLAVTYDDFIALAALAAADNVIAAEVAEITYGLQA
ncbi:hypothetical protein [Nocardia sp. NPDC051570]|uniref:hypothetical protein n=1 Tax=Nocardia sp. NPDC051570 TaxID=3364324 RepID=UPI00378FD9D9